jgi:hypothetical protein
LSSRKSEHNRSADPIGITEITIQIKTIIDLKTFMHRFQPESRALNQIVSLDENPLSVNAPIMAIMQREENNWLARIALIWLLANNLAFTPSPTAPGRG